MAKELQTLLRKLHERAFSEGGIADGLPTLTIAASEPEQLTLIDAFIQIGLASSKGEVRRLIRGGGARLNLSLIHI